MRVTNMMGRLRVGVCVTVCGVASSGVNKCDVTNAHCRAIHPPPQSLPFPPSLCLPVLPLPLALLLALLVLVLAPSPVPASPLACAANCRRSDEPTPRSHTHWNNRSQHSRRFSRDCAKSSRMMSRHSTSSRSSHSTDSSAYGHSRQHTHMPTVDGKIHAHMYTDAIALPALIRLCPFLFLFWFSFLRCSSTRSSAASTTVPLWYSTPSRSWPLSREATSRTLGRLASC